MGYEGTLFIAHEKFWRMGDHEGVFLCKRVNCVRTQQFTDDFTQVQPDINVIEAKLACFSFSFKSQR